jgi:hypothetical protein
MNCIIIDDEPIARQGMLSLINKVPELRFLKADHKAIEYRFFLADDFEKTSISFNLSLLRIDEPYNKIL